MNIVFLGQLGVLVSFGFAAIGSAIGLYVSGMATIGAWKKCSVNNRPAPLIMVAFAAGPLTNTIYGYILMNALSTSTRDPLQLLVMGLFGGIVLGTTAYTQARCGAYASDAFGETGESFVNYMLVIGLNETVALFTMIFVMLMA